MNTTEQRLTPAELAKRDDLRARKPYIADKLARISAMEAKGEISPIIRLEKSYLCNFQCSHCSAEYYMDRHIENVLKIEDKRRKMNLEDVRELSRQADDLGIARFVITGGEPLVMKDFDEVVAAIDPDKHYIVTDTNGWFLDEARARHLKEVGVEKVQLSLDSFIEAEHDAFRNKPGSYKRVMRAIDATLDAGLNLILATVLVRGRAKTKEFEDLCEFATNRGIGLYVSYAKPAGACSDHPELVIDKTDADAVRELEKRFKVFTHMTPSYGSFKGCITVKGIITVTSTMEVTPCPYIDMSLGNLRDTPLKEILSRGMRNPWLGPYRPDCLIGEDQQFIAFHSRKTKGAKLLPVPWEEGFSDENQLATEDSSPCQASSHFDASGRCLPGAFLGSPVNKHSRKQFVLSSRPIDCEATHRNLLAAFPDSPLPGIEEFEKRIREILARLADDLASANILNGVCVPFMLPQATHEDVGSALASDYLPRVEASFVRSIPDYRFVNHASAALNQEFDVIESSRHTRLIESMAEDAVVGCYFPCLSEYSIPAAVEQVAHMPKHFLLAGGYDTCAAFMACPDLLQRSDGYPPLLWLAALRPRRDEDSAFYFEAYGGDLTFNQRVHFKGAAEYWSSALVVLG